MKKRIIGAVLLAAAVCSGPAWANNRANTTQKGSLLIFPNIDVDPANSDNTLIEISNDQNAAVKIKCFYVNEQKARAPFSFDLTSKQTASWEVKTGTGDIAAPSFPGPGSFPGNQFKGELICFAVDAAASSQIAWNHLAGTATVVISADSVSTQPHQAYRYNAWSFMAKGAGGVAAVDGQIQGTPGDLQLTGAQDNKSYDACPPYNIANFMASGATLNGLRTIDNDLVVVSCNQDLKQDFKLHTTKLLFNLWNAHENDFSTFVCIDSVASVSLDSTFDISTLQTTNARFQVAGIPSSQCPFIPFGTTESAGLLGVLTSSVAIAGDADESQELGSTTQAAGMEAGFVLWDPHGPVLVTPKH